MVRAFRSDGVPNSSEFAGPLAPPFTCVRNRGIEPIPTLGPKPALFGRFAPLAFRIQVSSFGVRSDDKAAPRGAASCERASLRTRPRPERAKRIEGRTYTRRSLSAAARSVSSFFAKQNRSTGPPPSLYKNAEHGIEATPCSVSNRIAMSRSVSCAIAE